MSNEFNRYAGGEKLLASIENPYLPPDYAERLDAMTKDPQWPDEPFKAKHDASGTPVTVTPVGDGRFIHLPELCPCAECSEKRQQTLLPQSMRVGGGTVQDLHWADRNEAAYERIQKWLGDNHIPSPFVPSDIAGRAALIFTFDLLLAKLNQHEYRIARLENPTKPEGT